jgi:phosphatidylinositol glycan class M
MARQLLSNPTAVFSAAILLRVALIAWSRHQDAHSPVKYTDIDYFVFTDAARFVARGESPYARDTYRYTPLLAWLLVPTVAWFEFGKVLFAAADVLAGWLLVRVLTQHYGLTTGAATKYAAVWLLNPIVAGISTRGSCEGLLGVLAASLLLAVLQRNIAWAGVILGFAVHFKIYPFIYASSLVWYLDVAPADAKNATILTRFLRFFNRDRILLGVWSLGTFAAVNLAMYILWVARGRRAVADRTDTACRTSSIHGSTTLPDWTTATTFRRITLFCI